MDKMISGSKLHRVAKLTMDTGEASTPEEAVAILRQYRLAIEVGPDIGASHCLQAALLTAVNTGRRAFLGGVQVAGDLGAALCVPWRHCRTLRDAVLDLEGLVVDEVEAQVPRVVIGDAPLSPGVGEFAVRTTCNGWSGGVVPLAVGQRLPEAQDFTPAGVLAGALAVSEAFQFLRGDNPEAGRRAVGLSLWSPEAGVSWLEANPGPVLPFLPAKAWLIGLGHLGQAYLWTLGLLPYARPKEVVLVLQDFDEVCEANDSTCLLTTLADIGKKKTRAMAAWCEARGFRTAILERQFAANFKASGDEPLVALCGVDNAVARADLEEAGFQYVIEAGLGAGAHEYLTLQVHTFPARRTARSRWGGVSDAEAADQSLLQRPAYRALGERGVDACGVTELAGRAVGAPFVGAATAALVVAELIRLAAGAPCSEVIDIDLRSPAHRSVYARDTTPVFNPGITQARSG